MKLNAEQQKAVDCTDKKILCLACAGAGKTQVLVSRLQKLVYEDKVDPQSILCLTFTRAAAFEMRERYSKLQKSTKHSASLSCTLKPEISTFHAFCYSLILHDADVRKRIGYLRPPRILDPEESKKYQKEVIVQCNIKLPWKKLTPSAKRTKPEEVTYQLYNKAFRRLVRNRGYITFDILCDDVCKLFHFKDASIQKYLDKYKYIMIDEFQDTDLTQVKFMESFEDANWFCVGDALQNLYSFRGTSNSFIKNYSQDSSWTTIKMNQNYRSTDQICEFANKNSVYASSEYRIELVANKKGLSVEMDDSCTFDVNGDPYDDEVFNKVLSHVKPEHETAILCRTNSEVDCICSLFSKNGIAYTTNKKDITLENILKSSIDNQYLMDWLSTYLSSDKYANYVRLKTLEENPDVNWFVKNFGKVFWINKYLPIIAKVRHSIIESVNNNEPSEEMISKVIELLDLDIYNYSDFSNLSVREAISLLIEKIYETKMSEIYIGTVHSVKGLEFEDVIILGVNSSHFRLNTEDNHNVYYVAITRAKEHLVVMSETQ